MSNVLPPLGCKKKSFQNRELRIMHVILRAHNWTGFTLLPNTLCRICLVYVWPPDRPSLSFPSNATSTFISLSDRLCRDEWLADGALVRLHQLRFFAPRDDN